MTVVRSSDGRMLHLGRKLAEGGEGQILEVSGASDQLAKLYHKPVDAAKLRKLVAMIQLRTAELESVAAWPIDLICDHAGRCVGFIMPRVSGPGIIDKLSHPAEQRIAFPKVDYGFLVHVAMNLSRAAATLHAAGCVIGDVNQSNVFVLADGTVRFIDVDSFQVSHRGEVFGCPVGTPLFTPPELQNTPFHDVTRTPMHDGFGLAVLVFQLLIQGCHPFAGTPRDGRARTLEEAIVEGLYAHSPRLQGQVLPPPGRLPPSTLGELGSLFDRSFMGRDRPTATEWTHALDRVRGRLRRCTRNARHGYLNDLRGCPLCELPRDPLPASLDDQQGVADLGGLSIADLIRQAGELPELRGLAERRSEPDAPSSERTIPATPRNMPQAPAMASSNQASAYGVTGTIFLLAGFALMGKAVIGGFACLGLALVLYIASGMKASAETNKRQRIMAEVNGRQQAAMAAFEPIRREAQAALERLTSVEERVRHLESSAQDMLRPLVAEADKCRASLVSAQQQLKYDLTYADNSYRRHLVNEYLDTQFIAKATIPGIATSRKATLASFGIETAADIERSAIEQIGGFGPQLTERLLTWRQSCEHTYPNRGTVTAPSDWIKRINSQHNTRAQATASQLNHVLIEYRRRHGVLDRQLEAAATELDGAHRECRAAMARLAAA